MTLLAADLKRFGFIFAIFQVLIANYMCFGRHILSAAGGFSLDDFNIFKTLTWSMGFALCGQVYRPRIKRTGL